MAVVVVTLLLVVVTIVLCSKTEHHHHVSAEKAEISGPEGKKKITNPVNVCAAAEQSLLGENKV